MKKKLFLFLSLCFFVAGSILAQTQVRGTIVDENGEPAIGATIQLKGDPTKGTTTDADGKFTLSAPANGTLVISYVGYTTQEVKVSPNVNIQLKPDSELLQEVVVTGMTRTDKRLFTGATDNLSAEDTRLAGLADISRGLEGKSAGVSVQNVSGTFGTAPKIRVRGATSIYGSSKPLWVVDGVIMEDVVELGADDLSSGDATTLISSAIAGLNAEDIESFQILKDGSATSIYGARAMAGVIVVTTKKGKAGTSAINYSGEYTYRMKPSYRDFNIMNSQDQMSVYQEMETGGWLNYADLATARESGIYGKMYQLLSVIDPATGEFALANTPEAKAAHLRLAEKRNTDWFSLLFNNNMMHNHSVSVSSGTEKSSFYASLSAMLDEGWTKASSVNRYTANLNTTYNISNALSVNLISNASYRKQKAPGTLSQEVDAVSGSVKRDFDINPYSYALNTSRALDPNETYTRNYAPFNILKELEENFIDLNIVDFRIQGELKWKPIRNMETSILGALKYQTSLQEHHITEFSNQAMAYRTAPTVTIRDRNPFLYKDPDNPYAIPIVVLPEGGIFQKTMHNMLAYDFRATTLYNTVIAEKNIINLFGGMEINSSDRHRTWDRGWGMQYSMGEIPFYTYEMFKKSKEEGSQYYSLGNTRSRSVAFFGNATYSWNGIYTINGTLRYEGTNKLGKSRSARWLPTWNVSGAWNIHEEEFFESLKPTLSHLSLKTSYSLTADRGPAWLTNSRVVIQSYNPWRKFAGVQESGLQISSLENSELTYEKKHELNIGLAVGFLNNRINLTADWYRRNNFDLIGQINTQGIGGEVTKYGNVATMKSNGIEFSLTTQNIKTKDFSWSTNFIYSHLNNEITELKNRTRVIDLISGNGFARTGYPVRSIFSIPFMGLNEEGLPTFLDQNNNTTVSDIYFQERDKIDFLKYSGPAEPTDLGSLGNIFTYKNFRLNVFISYSFGNVVRLNPVFSNRYTDLTSHPKEFKNRWVVPGDEKLTDVPVISSTRQNRNNTQLSYAYNAYNFSDARIAKGDFIRLKDLSLTYDFDKSLIENTGLNNLSLRLQGTNLLLLYADKKLNGQDPEFFNSGGVAVPIPRQFTLTLRLGL